MIFLSIANLSQEHKLIDMQVWRNLSEYPNLWFGNTNLCKIYFNRFCRQTNLSQEYKLIDMQVWRNWQTRMVQVAPPRCKFISVTISCELWIKRYAPPRFSHLNRVKIQREKLNMHPWRNWQTRMVQVHIFERKCRFNSCRVHQLLKGIYKGILFSYAEVYNG